MLRWGQAGAVETTVSAVFDGEVFRPEGPVALPAHRRYRLTVEEVTPSGDEDGAETEGSELHPLSAIGALAVDMGVEDLAANHSRYARRRPRLGPAQ